MTSTMTFEKDEYCPKKQPLKSALIDEFYLQNHTDIIRLKYTTIHTVLVKVYKTKKLALQLSFPATLR